MLAMERIRKASAVTRRPPLIWCPATVHRWGHRVWCRIPASFVASHPGRRLNVAQTAKPRGIDSGPPKRTNANERRLLMRLDRQVPIPRLSLSLRFRSRAPVVSVLALLLASCGDDPVALEDSSAPIATHGVALAEATGGPVWDGEAADGLWSNPLNWSGDVLPSATDDITIHGGFGDGASGHGRGDPEVLGVGPGCGAGGRRRRDADAGRCHRGHGIQFGRCRGGGGQPRDDHSTTPR